MDEEITIIDSNTRNEKIKNFFIKNKNNLISLISTIIILIIVYFSYVEVKNRNKVKLANQYRFVIDLDGTAIGFIDLFDYTINSACVGVMIT